MSPLSNEERLLAMADTFVATRVRMEALTEKLDHVREKLEHVANKVSKAIDDVDQLQDRVSRLEYARQFSRSWWRWGLAIVGGLAATVGVAQAFLAMLGR